MDDVLSAGSFLLILAIAFGLGYSVGSIRTGADWRARFLRDVRYSLDAARRDMMQRCAVWTGRIDRRSDFEAWVFDARRGSRPPRGTVPLFLVDTAGDGSQEDGVA